MSSVLFQFACRLEIVFRTHFVQINDSSINNCQVKTYNGTYPSSKQVSSTKIVSYLNFWVSPVSISLARNSLPMEIVENADAPTW